MRLSLSREDRVATSTHTARVRHADQAVCSDAWGDTCCCRQSQVAHNPQIFACSLPRWRRPAVCRARERDLQHAGPGRDRMICDAALVSERFEFSLEADELCLETERVLRETERVLRETERVSETERERERERERETWYALVNMKYLLVAYMGQLTSEAVRTLDRQILRCLGGVAF